MKGIAKYQLYDAETMQLKQEVVEENAITPMYNNLFKDYMKYRHRYWSTYMNYNTVNFMNVVNFVDGIALLEDAQLTTDSIAKGNIVGVAGTSGNTGTGNPKTGDRLEYTLSDNSLVQKWQWNTTQGIGTINCISLGGGFNSLNSTSPRPYMTIANATTDVLLNGSATNAVEFVVRRNPLDATQDVVVTNDNSDIIYTNFSATPDKPSFDETTNVRYNIESAAGFVDAGLTYCLGGAKNFGSDGFFYIAGKEGADSRVVKKYDPSTWTLVSTNTLGDNWSSSTNYQYYFNMYVVGDYVYWQDYAQNTTTQLVIKRVKLSTMGVDTDESANAETLILNQHSEKMYYFGITAIEDGKLFLNSRSALTSTVSQTVPGMWYILDEATFTVDDYTYSTASAAHYIPLGYIHDSDNHSDVNVHDIHFMDAEQDAPTITWNINSRAMFTVNNLGTPIVKTGADILIIEYTLTW